MSLHYGKSTRALDDSSVCYSLVNDMDQIGEPPQPRHAEGFKFLLGVAEVLGGVLVILMAIWTSSYRGGFAWTSNPGMEFNWHPLLMTIGLVFIYANAMLIYRIQRNVRKKRLKLIHGGMMLFIVLLTVIALVAVFDSHNLKVPPIPNMYTLHSWVGLTTVILFCLQLVAGCVSFLYPGLHAPLRASYMPIHVYFGVAGFIGAIAACLMGLNEKAIFALGGDYAKLTSEGVLINVIGLFFILFGGLVIYLVSHEQYRRLPRPEDDVLLTNGREQRN